MDRTQEKSNTFLSGREWIRFMFSRRQWQTEYEK